MFAKLKLRQRILLGYLIPFLLLLTVIIAVYANARTAQQANTELNETRPFVRDVLIAADCLVRMQRASNAYVLTNGKTYNGEIGYPKKIYESSALKYQALMKKLDPLSSKVAQQDALRKIAVIGSNITQITQLYMRLIDEGKEDLAIAEVRRGESIKLFEQIDPLIDTIVNTETARRDQQSAVEAKAIDGMQSTVVFGTLLSILLIMVLGLWIADVISRDISVNAIQLASASSEIAATITQQERTLSQQSTSINETSATIEQLSASSRQSMEQAANSAALAERSSSSTMQGRDATKQTVEAINSLQDKIGAMADHILHLGEQTGQIGSIATLLKDLAGQINMLSLNAAVEAARAGEHGKGFAVVAGEIRKLADQSRKSAEQTAVLVADIQKSTNSSILVTEEGTRTVTEVTQLVQKVAELFNNLASMAGSVNENAQQLMLNTKQQSAAFAQVVQATNSIADGAMETVAGIGQTKAGVQILNKAADKLKAIV